MSNLDELREKLNWWLSKMQVETVKNHRPIMITREDQDVLEKAAEGILNDFSHHLEKETLRATIDVMEKTLEDWERPYPNNLTSKELSGRVKYKKSQLKSLTTNKSKEK